MTLLKVYQCSVSKYYDYKLINKFESYTVKAIHNNRLAIGDDIGMIFWIDDRGYNLEIGSNIKFDLHSINVYDSDGYITEKKDYNYKTRVKDMKCNKGKKCVIEAIVNLCDELKDIIAEAEIDCMVK